MFHVTSLTGDANGRRIGSLVARSADACNLFDIPDGGRTIRHKLDLLRKRYDEAGRPYDDIEKTLSTRLNPGDTVRGFSSDVAMSKHHSGSSTRW